MSGSTSAGIIVGIIVGSVLTACAMAFFAYVLDLLIDIEGNTYQEQEATDNRLPVYPEPGWYEDPQGIATARYWDGEQWTDSTQPPPPTG